MQTKNKKNMNYKVHYAAKKLNGDIPVYSFSTLTEVLAFTLTELNNSEDTVFLLSINDLTLVSEYAGLIAGSIDSTIKAYSPTIIKNGISELDEEYDNEFDIFIQEYSSYQEAYKVALEMAEESPLCYS